MSELKVTPWSLRDANDEIRHQIERAEKAEARVAELEGQLRDMRILGGKTLAERNDALARVAELEAENAGLRTYTAELEAALNPTQRQVRNLLAKRREG